MNERGQSERFGIFFPSEIGKTDLDKLQKSISEGMSPAASTATVIIKEAEE